MQRTRLMVVTRRSAVLLIVLSVLLLDGACVSRRVQVPRLLTPIQESTLSELVERVNETQKMVSLMARIDIQLESQVEANRGQSERYTTAVGRWILARAKKVYLQIQAPVVKTNFAEFA